MFQLFIKVNGAAHGIELVVQSWALSKFRFSIQTCIFLHWEKITFLHWEKKNYSFIYWSGTDLIMPTLAFPLCPRVYNNLISTLESKLGFSEIQGWNQWYFIASGKAGKLNLTSHCFLSLSEISLALFSFAILQRGPMGSILDFCWCVFWKKWFNQNFLQWNLEVQYLQF